MRHHLTIISLTVLMIIVFSGVLQADLICNLCGQKISGTYYRSPNGDIYCDRCWSSHTVCSQCGKLVTYTTEVNGMKLCRDCYAKLERCSLCGKPLVGTYMQFPNLGLKVCAQCQDDKPHCDKCGVPTNDPVKVGGATLCERCARRTEKCHSCGQALLNDFTFYEGNKEVKYCSKCVDKYPRCDDCGAPIGPDGTTLNDGRHLCPDCRRIAYFDLTLVNSIKNKVLAFVSGNMGMPVMHRVNFSLEDQGFLKQKAKDIHGDINGLFYRKGGEFDIYILYGLREKDLISVIAHEYSHAWQSENCPKDMGLENQEGFAQWVAYKALRSSGHDDFAALMSDGDNIYAKGLNKMLKLESQRGAGAVFEFIKRAK